MLIMLTVREIMEASWPLVYCLYLSISDLIMQARQGILDAS